jgi:hypothetical protein
VHPALLTTKEPPTLYPPPKVETVTQQTHVSYHNEPISELKQNDHGNWSLCVSVPVPSNIINPTLTSLVYVIKYATTHDNGNSTVQSDIVLTATKCPEGITFKSTDLGIYRNGSAYGPKMVKDESVLLLSTAPGVKCNGGNAQWSHYIDHCHLIPNVRIVDSSFLYLTFHVNEYPTTQTSRSLAIEVSASWAEDLEARKAKEEAERKAKEEADRKAREEAERKAREEAERKAREEAERKAKEEAERKAKEEAERKAREEAERKAKEEAEQKAREAEEERKRKEAAKPVGSVADQETQDTIKEAARRFGAECPNGFGWVKTDYGYVCSGGGHKLTFEQLASIQRS